MDTGLGQSSVPTMNEQLTKGRQMHQRVSETLCGIHVRDECTKSCKPRPSITLPKHQGSEGPVPFLPGRQLLLKRLSFSSSIAPRSPGQSISRPLALIIIAL